jgi:hypothetical protein
MKEPGIATISKVWSGCRQVAIMSIGLLALQQYQREATHIEM